MSIIENLKTSGFSLVAADLKGEQHVDFARFDKIIMALGNEGSGLSDVLLKSSNDRVRIPVDSEKAESLNVAVSGAILMFASMCGTSW